MSHALRFYLIALILLTSTWAQAHIAKDCDDEVLPVVMSVKKAVELFLTAGQLEIQDVKHMIAQPGKVQDPFSLRPRDVDNLAFRTELEKRLARLKAEHMPQAHDVLTKLIDEKSQIQARVQEVRAQTARVLKPVEVKHLAINSAAPHREGKTWTTPTLTWHKTNHGDLRLVIFDGYNAYLQVFDPLQSQPVVDRELRPKLDKREIKGTTKSFTTSDGHLLLIHKHYKDAELTLYDLENDKLEIKNDFLHSIKDVEPVRGKNGRTYLIIRADEVIYTYLVDANLKLREISRRTVHARFFKVINSADGDILVAAVVGSSRVVCFDPLSLQVRREHKAQYHVKELSGIFTPKGDYALAIGTQSLGDTDVQYEFLTSKSEKHFESRVLSNDTVAGEWYIDRAGNPLFPVRANYLNEVRTHLFYIYDPLRPVFRQPKDWNVLNMLSFDRHEIEPLFKVNGGEKWGFAAPVLTESLEGRLLLLSGSANGNVIELNLYDPEAQFTAIQNIPIHGNESIQRVQVGHFKDSGQRVYFLTRLAHQPFQLHMESGHLSLSGKSDLFTSVVEGPEGHFYLAGMGLGRDRSPGLQLYRLTTKIGEAGSN